MPRKLPSDYDTKLSTMDEIMFRQWLAENNVPFNPDKKGQDYDMRGYYLGLQQGRPESRPTQIDPIDQRPHYPDTYKTPSHEMFSNESQYAGPNAPRWGPGDSLGTPSGRRVPAQQLSFRDELMLMDANKGIIEGMMGSRRENDRFREDTQNIESLNKLFENYAKRTNPEPFDPVTGIEPHDDTMTRAQRQRNAEQYNQEYDASRLRTIVPEQRNNQNQFQGPPPMPMPRGVGRNPMEEAYNTLPEPSPPSYPMMVMPPSGQSPEMYQLFNFYTDENI